MTPTRAVRFVSLVWGLCAALAMAAIPPGHTSVQRETSPSMLQLVPSVESWKRADDTESYFPESLFEYINGAAESYLSYEFKELLVVQFEKEEAEASLTLEIYDMANPLNAFGIFSAERYPESPAVSVGDVGYFEGEALNFLRGKYYVKLLGFGGDGMETVLRTAAQGVSERIKEKTSLPPLLAVFPPDNLIPKSEKFIKKNFMGYEFLSNGFVASYKIDGREIECFLIDADSETAAESMEKRLLDFFTEDKQIPKKIDFGYRIENRYSQHLFIGRMGHFLYGVMRVPDGLEGSGELQFEKLRNALANKTGPAA